MPLFFSQKGTKEIEAGALEYIGTSLSYAICTYIMTPFLPFNTALNSLAPNLLLLECLTFIMHARCFAE